MLGLLAGEVLLEQVDLVVLPDTLSRLDGHIAGSLGETESGVTIHLLHVTSDISSFRRVHVVGPTTLLVAHTAGSGRNTLGVNLMMKVRHLKFEK